MMKNHDFFSIFYDFFISQHFCTSDLKKVLLVRKSGFKRNPKNGATFFVKEKKKISFKVSKSWTNKINEKI